MKKALIGVFIPAVLLLAACGGGGGGGGGGKGTLAAPAQVNWWGGTPPVAPFSAGAGTSVATAGDAFSVGDKTMGATTMFSRLNGGNAPFQITKTADGLVLSTRGGMSRDVSMTVSGGHFKTNSDGYITAVRESTGRFSDSSSFSYKAQDTVVLGGKLANLSYSDFGLWDSYERVIQDGQGPDDGFSSNSFLAFSMGDDSKRTGVNGLIGAQTFTGKTVAVAHGGGQAGISHLTGTASLGFTPGGGSVTGNLGLDFSGFGTFAIPVTITTNTGVVSASNASVTASGGPYGGRNMENPTASVDGQFYGNIAGMGTEAVGQYQIHSSPSSSSVGYTVINGSFGVK